MMLTVLIVDDEPLARTHLRRMLEAQSVQILGEAGSAPEALGQAEDLRPDLITLDVQMPGLSGLQMAGALLQLDTPPLIAFVSGFAEHATEAFDQNAVDYLLKPVEPERVARMLVRVRERLADRLARQQSGSRIEEQSPQPPLTRLPIRGDYKVKLVRLEEIFCATAREKRVYVRTPEGEHRTYYTLNQLESLLPVEKFLRIHDSCIVNLDRVIELLFLGNHAYVVRLEDNQQLPVGRSRYAELQRRLGIDAVSG